MKRLFLAFLFVAQSALAATPLPAGAAFDVGFSPGGSSQQVVLQGIASAHSEILVVAYGFSSRPIAQALADAHQRGVKVAVVADRKSGMSKYSQLAWLASRGVAVRVNDHYAILHHKFMVIDGAQLETGSFNYTQSALRANAENVLLLWNVPTLAAVYAKEWARLWDEGENVAPAEIP